MYVIIYVKDKKKVNFRAHKKKHFSGKLVLTIDLGAQVSRFRLRGAQQHGSTTRKSVTSAWLFFLVLWMRSKNGCIIYYMLFERKCRLKEGEKKNISNFLVEKLKNLHPASRILIILSLLKAAHNKRRKENDWKVHLTLHSSHMQRRFRWFFVHDFRI